MLPRISSIHLNMKCKSWLFNSGILPTLLTAAFADEVLCNPPDIVVEVEERLLELRLKEARPLGLGLRDLEYIILKRK